MNNDKNRLKVGWKYEFDDVFHLISMYNSAWEVTFSLNV